MKRLILIPVVALAAFAAPSAWADEITLIAPGGIRTAVEKGGESRREDPLGR